MVDDDYLSHLNDQQRDAVVYLGGPELVVAGAGSGKTRVLTYKIVHLLRQGYEPWRILALTFTNKAAREMRTRIEQMAPPEVASRLWMGTFHSIFARLLRINAESIGFRSNFTIYDASDSKSLIKTIIRDLELDDKVYKPNVIAAIISRAKNDLVTPERYLADRSRMGADEHAGRPYVGRVYSVYCQSCRNAGAMDFDDLLLYTNTLLRTCPDVLARYQDYFRYILVDEYQDTNRVQHAIVEMLCEKSGALCVVGDDAQSIYSFRGADIRNILNLRGSFSTLRIFKLEQNYRSTQNIINAANSLIAKNKDQIPKHVFSRGDVGAKIDVVQTASDYEEAVVVANKVAQMQMRSHDPYNEFAVLYRTNSQSRRLEEMLRKRNIPYRIYGGLSFYQRKEVKDVVAYMRLAVNPDDDEAFKRVVNYPARGIGATTVERLVHTAMTSGVSLWRVATSLSSYATGLNAGAARKVGAFAALVQKFVGMATASAPAYDVACAIVKDTSILASFDHDNTPETISKRENIQELLQGVLEFAAERMAQLHQATTLADFLANAALATDQDMSDANGEAVTLMTVHAAKGLEFNNVIVVGVEEDLFPASMSSDTLSGVEEERRLLYVAITRARRRCMLTYADTRYRNGQSGNTRPSRFIKDIDPALINFSPGASRQSAAAGPVRSPGGIVSTFDNFRAMPGMGANAPRRTFSHPLLDGSAARPAAAAPSSSPIAAPQADFASHQASELTTGMRIVHPVFGRGVITLVNAAADSPNIAANFGEQFGEKKLLLRFARFAIIDK